MSVVGDALSNVQPQNDPPTMYNMVCGATNYQLFNTYPRLETDVFYGVRKTDVEVPVLTPSHLLTDQHATALANACKAIAAKLGTAYTVCHPNRMYTPSAALDLHTIFKAFHEALGVSADVLLPEMRLGTVLAPVNLLDTLLESSLSSMVCPSPAHSPLSGNGSNTALLAWFSWSTARGDAHFANGGASQTAQINMMVPPSYVAQAFSNAIVLARKGVAFYPAMYYGTLLARANDAEPAGIAYRHMAGLASAFAAACLTYGPEGRNGGPGARHGEYSGRYTDFSTLRALRLFGGTPQNCYLNIKADVQSSLIYPQCAALLESRPWSQRDYSHAAVFQWAVLVDPAAAQSAAAAKIVEERTEADGARTIDTKPVLFEYRPHENAGTQVRQTRLPMLPTNAGWYAFANTEFGIPHLVGRESHGLPVLLLPAGPESYRFLCGLYGKKPYDNITPLPRDNALLFATLYTPAAFMGVIGTDITQEKANKHYKIHATKGILQNMYGPLAETTPTLAYLGTTSLTDFVDGVASSDAPELQVNVYLAPIVVTN